MRCVLVRVSVSIYKGPEHMLELVLFFAFVFVVFLSVFVSGLKPKFIHSVGRAIRGS